MCVCRLFTFYHLKVSDTCECLYSCFIHNETRKKNVCRWHKMIFETCHCLFKFLNFPFNVFYHHFSFIRLFSNGKKTPWNWYSLWSIHWSQQLTTKSIFIWISVFNPFTTKNAMPPIQLHIYICNCWQFNATNMFNQYLDNLFFNNLWTHIIKRIAHEWNARIMRQK